MSKNYQDIFQKKRVMNKEGELILPDVTTYSKATVIKWTIWGAGTDIDEKLSDVQDSCSVTLYILTVVFATVSDHELKFLFRATRSN